MALIKSIRNNVVIIHLEHGKRTIASVSVSGVAIGCDGEHPIALPFNSRFV